MTSRRRRAAAADEDAIVEFDDDDLQRVEMDGDFQGGGRSLSTFNGQPVASLKLRVGTYNVLSPTYALEQQDREGIKPAVVGHGKKPVDISNWEDRWPAILRALDAPWDILALQEVEEATRESVVEGMAGLGLLVEWFEHPGLCLDEGILSLFSLICCSYGYSTYKQE
jgi:hypothetical protein